MSPPPAPLAWVVGSGGLVGRHVTATLRRHGHEVVTTAVPWDDPAASVATLVEAAGGFARRRAGRPWTLAWCAGAGVVATPVEELRRELDTFRTAIDALADGVRPGEDGVVFLASSAGGVYAGSSGPPYSETSEPHPLVAYGETKLAMERYAAIAAARSGLRLLAGRIANVYGPGQRLDKPQGLVSQICLSHATGAPLPVRVSLDTIRDYVFVGDLAEMVLAATERARTGAAAGESVVKVLASGRPVTVGYLIGEARRVLHRPLRTIPVAGGGAGQVLDLRLRSGIWPEVDALASTTLAAGLSRTAADVLGRVARAELLG